MSDPITAIAIGATILGGATAASGAIKSGNAAYQSQYYQAQVSDRNAQIAQMNAAEALKQGAIAEQAQRRQTQQLKGQQRATLAGLGQVLDQGTAGLILADTAQLGESDALTIRRNAQRDAFGFNLQANDLTSDAAMQRSAGSSARTAGILSAAGTALQTIGSTAGMAHAAAGAPSTAKNGTLLGNYSDTSSSFRSLSTTYNAPAAGVGTYKFY